MPLWRRRLMTTDYERIAADVVAAIQAGTYTPGQRIPSVRELTQQTGKAKGTVEAAIDVLKDNGWVVGRPGSGLFVADPLPLPPAAAQALEERVADHDAQLAEIWERLGGRGTPPASL